MSCLVLMSQRRQASMTTTTTPSTSTLTNASSSSSTFSDNSRVYLRPMTMTARTSASTTMTTLATKSHPGRYEDPHSNWGKWSDILSLCKWKVIFIISWPPTFIAKTLPTLRTPIKAWDRLGNYTLGPFPIIVVTKFCCTYQSLVPNRLLLGVGAAAPTPFK